MSFTAVIDNLVATLQNDTALTAYCNSEWGKGLTVKPVYKHRTEINLTDLPIVLITRPTLKKIFLVGGPRNEVHTMRLYCGFHQPDRAKALAEFIEYEEKIDGALIADRNRGGHAIETDPLTSINDEGEFHPVYFMVMEANITVEV
jgi:hypothetical protein